MTAPHQFTTKARKLSRDGTLTWGGEGGWDASLNQPDGVTIVDGVVKPIPARGLVAHWTGDVRTDSTIADSVGDHDGTLHGVTRTTTSRSGSTGLQYDADGDSIVVPDAPELNPTNEITVSVWYYGESFTGAGSDPLVHKPYTTHTSPYYQYSLWIQGTEYQETTPRAAKFTVSINGGERVGAHYAEPDVYQIGEWTHLVGTYDGETVTLYRDGEPVAATKGVGTIDAYDTDVWLGRYANNDSNIRGTLDSVRLYNRSLTATEVRTLHEAEA